MVDALSIIRGEHRHFAEVLRQLEDAAGANRGGDPDPDFDLLLAIIEYIESFVDSFHHMKEDLYLFPAVCKRHPAASAVLDLLHDEHRSGGVLLSDLKGALAEYRRYGSDAYPAFRETTLSYVAMERDHIEREETEILPLAQEFLTPDDHRVLDDVFGDNDDPLFGDEPRKTLRRLHARIVAP